jgi:hypothetical protein
MKNLKTKLLFIGGFLLALSCLYGQCAMCKQAATSSLEKNPNSIASGLNSGIIYLMLTPYILILLFFRKKIVRFLKEYFELYKKPVN